MLPAVRPGQRLSAAGTATVSCRVMRVAERAAASQRAVARQAVRTTPGRDPWPGRAILVVRSPACSHPVDIVNPCLSHVRHACCDVLVALAVQCFPPAPLPQLPGVSPIMDLAEGLDTPAQLIYLTSLLGMLSVGAYFAVRRLLFPQLR